ncbi:hydroxymethylglutaryl-CoA reductase [Candidatus Roizmanbacteria bacterium]|nr:hydroxymethylglutaryl-CoA reductase [Candidatus Roizmanbacteria bacterium]
MDLRNYTDAKNRRTALEQALKITLPAIGSFSLSEDFASHHNCENMVGAVQIPLGIAGPLDFSDDKKHTVYIPLATTEGALVASVNRGIKAVTLSGGASVTSHRAGISRAPVFVVTNGKAANVFIDWIETNQKLLNQIAQETSTHLKLISIKTWHSGRNVFVRCSYDTQDAMGMNMATIATEKMVSFITKETGVVCASVSGNMCGDKKANMLNVIEGRGIQTWADVELSPEIIKDVLKTTVPQFVETAHRKLDIGSRMSGTIGANAHAANVLAAIFLATGQDMAHVGEASTVMTEVEQGKNGVYVSVYIPDLPVGTVGGGTALETQQECLKIMGITGATEGENVKFFAHCIAGVVLAGEISLLAALSAGHLSSAHQKLARGTS